MNISNKTGRAKCSARRQVKIKFYFRLQFTKLIARGVFGAPVEYKIKGD